MSSQSSKVRSETRQEEVRHGCFSFAAMSYALGDDETRPVGGDASAAGYSTLNPDEPSWNVSLVNTSDDAISSSTSSSSGPIQCIEVPFQTRIPGEPMQKEATAQAMDASAKGVLHSSAAFLGPALIQLATNSAKEQFCRDQQQQDDNNRNNNCDPDTENIRIYGVLPSSILTVASVVATVSAALMLPLVGALIDRSRHRKLVGAATAYALVLINALQILLSQQTWPFFWITHALSDALNMVHNMIILAYLQNLTTEIHTLAIYSAKFAFVQFGFMASYMLLITAFAHIQQADIVQTSRVAHMLSATVGCVSLGYAWLHLFGERPPRQLPGDSIFVSSLTGLRTTLSRIREKYPALKWLLVTLLFSPSVGSGSYLSIFATLQKALVLMSSAQIGLANLIALMSTLIGAKLSGYLCRKINPLRTFQFCIATFAITVAATALFVRGPEQVHLYFGLTGLLGMSLGWLLPTERVLFCSLAPPGQEAEIMGLILCVHSATAWLPPLLFSAINESGYSLRWALASQNAVLGLALLTSLGIGSFDSAVRQARDDDDVHAPCDRDSVS